MSFPLLTGMILRAGYHSSRRCDRFSGWHYAKNAVCPFFSALTMVVSSRRNLSRSGLRRRVSDLLLFHRGSPGRTALSKVSMTNTAMNVCSANGSLPCSMLRLLLRIGVCTIIPGDPIVHSTTRPRRILPPSLPTTSNLLNLSFLLDTKTKAGHTSFK